MGMLDVFQQPSAANDCRVLSARHQYRYRIGALRIVENTWEDVDPDIDPDPDPEWF